MKKCNYLLMLVLAFSAFYVGCTKGEQGPAGPKGTTGSANVRYSTWAKLAMTKDPNDSTLFDQTIKADSLTQGILDSGIVLTYLKYQDPNSLQTSVVNASSYMEEDFSVGSIQLYSAFDFSGLYYRYVLIPGGVKVGRLSSGKLVTRDNLKTLTYQEALEVTGQKE